MMLIIFEHHGAPVPIHTNCSAPPANVQTGHENGSMCVFAAASKYVRHEATDRITAARKSPSIPLEELSITSPSVSDDRQPTRQEQGAQLAKVHF